MKAENRIFLNVPFDEKDFVKKLGAKWDGKERGWWIALSADREDLRRWLPRKYNPDLAPPYILPELVPAPSWYINLRALLPKEEWDRLRRDCYDRAGNRCQVCGGRGSKWPVECDEHWCLGFR